MKKVIILTVLGLMGQSAWAQIRNFQTTRLMSTSGTGVASILSTEAAVLNPAASAFFTGSSFSYQSYSTSLKHENDVRDTAPDKFPNHNSSSGVFMTDNSGLIKGGVAYLKQHENSYERETMVLHGAAPMGKSSSVGISYNYIQDKIPRSGGYDHAVHHQLVLGTTHIIDEDTIVGLVVKDPTRTNSGDERVLAGFQYEIADRFTLIGDVGARYTKAVNKYYQWSAAVQLNVFSDFFIRAGQFYDNITYFKGTSWGASWMGPRFGVEFAQKFSEQIGSGTYIYKNEKFVDTSLSALIKF